MTFTKKGGKTLKASKRPNKRESEQTMSVVQARNFEFEECEEVSELNPSKRMQMGITTRMQTTGMGTTAANFHLPTTATVSSAVAPGKRGVYSKTKGGTAGMNKTFQV